MILKYSWTVLTYLFSGCGVFLIQWLFRLYNRRGKKVFFSCYKGFYSGYYINPLNSSSVVVCSIEIKMNKWGVPIVVVERQHFNYEGRFNTRGHTNNVLLKGNGHSEEVHIVFYKPLNNDFRYLFGTCSGISADRNPVAGKIIWCKEVTKVTPSITKIEDIDDVHIKEFLSGQPNQIIVGERLLDQ